MSTPSACPSAPKFPSALEAVVHRAVGDGEKNARRWQIWRHHLIPDRGHLLAIKVDDVGWAVRGLSFMTSALKGGGVSWKSRQR